MSKTAHKDKQKPSWLSWEGTLLDILQESKHSAIKP